MDHCSKCNCQLSKDPDSIENGWLRYDCPQCNSAYYLPATQPHYTPAPHSQDKEDNAKIYIIIFLVFIVISIALIGLHSRNINMSIIFLIGALVTMLTGFIKYPRNRVIQVLFLLIAALMVLTVIAVIISIIACINDLSDFPYADFNA